MKNDSTYRDAMLWKQKSRLFCRDAKLYIFKDLSGVLGKKVGRQKNYLAEYEMIIKMFTA